jgi:hypothetical protein
MATRSSSSPSRSCAPRLPAVRKRETTLRAKLDALDAELHDAETYFELTDTLDEFCTRLSADAEILTAEQRQPGRTGACVLTRAIRLRAPTMT